MITTTAVKAIIYLRLSDLRDDDPDSFDDREKLLRAKALQLGWTVVRVVVENDLARGKDGKVRGASAFKRRKVILSDGATTMRVVRPGWASIIEDFKAGHANGLLAEDLDRTMRDLLDLEELITVVEAKKINADSLSGSLKFTTGDHDSQITMARVMVAIANKSSRDTSRRVAAARSRKAHNGEFGGGKRPYGYEASGATLRWDEALVIETASRRVIQGASLRGLALELREAEAPSVQGQPWTAANLRRVLLRPRNSAIKVYRGEEIGRAPWPAIVSEDVFRAVVRALTAPERKMGPGSAPKYLGTGVYRCGKCADGSSVQVTLGGREPQYRCAGNCYLSRNQACVDELVMTVVAGQLSHPNAVTMFAQSTTTTVDVAALRTESDAVRSKLNGLAEDYAMDLIDRGQMISATARARTRLAEIDQALATAVVESPLAAVIGAGDVRAALEGASLSLRRQIVAAVAEVVIEPSRRGAGFDPTSITVELDQAKWRFQS